MIHQWNDALRKRIAERIIVMDRNPVRDFYAAAEAEDCSMAYWQSDLDEFTGWLITCENPAYTRLASKMVSAIVYEWKDARHIAMTFRDAVSNLTDWTPAGDPDRAFIDQDARSTPNTAE
jgi:hypothetical protein